MEQNIYEIQASIDDMKITILQIVDNKMDGAVRVTCNETKDMLKL